MMEKLVYKSIDQEVWHEKLDNGLNIFVIPKNDFSRTYAFFATNYGGCDRRFRIEGKWHDTPAGVAHFLEHKMFDMPWGNALSKLSANGASPNAFTSLGITGYLFKCTEKFEENLKILLDFVTTPYFTDESVEKEQGIIAQEIKMGEDDPNRAVYDNFMRSLYAYNPVRDTVAGTVESIAEITPQVLNDCYNAFYNPANMVLCIAGKAEPEKISLIVKKAVTAKKKAIPQRDYGKEESMLPAKVRTEVNMEVSMPLFMFGAKVSPEGDGRTLFKRLIAGQLACEMIVGESSTLYDEMYSQGLVNRSLYCGTSDFPDGAFWICGGESRNAYGVMEKVLEKASEIAEKGSEELFERLKKAMLGSTIRTLDSMENMCHNEAEAFFKGYSSFEARDLLLGITIDDVRQFIREYFSIEHMAMSVVNPLKDETKGK